MKALLPILLLIASMTACQKKTDEPKTKIIVTLSSPATGSTVSPMAPLRFTWTGNGVGTTGAISYKIKIVEIKGDESPENAIRTNKPFFEKDSLNYFTVAYPFSDLPVTTTKYAWQVTAREVGGTGAMGTSESWSIKRQ